MKQEATIVLYKMWDLEIAAGGKGSGCNPDAGKCGRPAGSGSKDPVKSQLAKLSFKPTNIKKYQIAKSDERRTARLIGGDAVSHNRPFDVLRIKAPGKLRIGVEVKSSIDLTAHPRCNLKVQHRLDKEADMKKLKLDKVFMVAYDRRNPKNKLQGIYVREGIHGYWYHQMKKVNSMEELRQVLLGEE